MDHCALRGPWADAVRRSLVMLKALTYAPTGGIVAAATTSLPEQLGGSRNWDYRYCWLRDATFTLQALLGTGYVAEARAWRDWLLRAVAGDPADLRIMYALDGTRRIPEYELPVAVRATRAPHRCGSATPPPSSSSSTSGARSSTGCTSAGRPGLSGTADAWDLQRALLDFLEGAWDRPDNSLWEVRGPQRHFVHSKVMAWAGVDRAVQAVERFGLDGPVDRWRRLRQEIHDDVCAKGYDADRNTFTQFYGSARLGRGAAADPPRRLPAMGRPAGDRHRGRRRSGSSTTTGSCCATGPTPTADDGLPGHRGGIPGVHVLARRRARRHGPHRRGRAAVRAAARAAQRPRPAQRGVRRHRERRQVGNTPQAFSQVGLVNTARHLSGSSAAPANREKENTR